MTILALATAVSGVVSCDSFLDRQEDEQMTFEKIWQQVATTRRYFFQAMSYLPNDSQIFYGSAGGGHNMSHTIACADESTLCWAWSHERINYGSWNATNIPNDNYNWYYEGIRDANVFMQNVMSCSDPLANRDDLTLWYNCARWARAYYYFMLMRDWGPVFLLGDDPIDFNATFAQLARPRNTWEECVDYVVSEMEWCAARLPDRHNSTYMGLPTRGTALAVIARLKLYSASPLFNGNNLYRTVTNPDGTPLFPRDFNAHKWVEAAQAAKAVIDTGLYSLYRDESNDPCLNYLGITMKAWNDEIIYAGGGYQGRGWIVQHTTPASTTLGGAMYGGWGVTQQQVDAYAMSNGRYPITGYENDGSPKIDAASGYSANEFSKQRFSNPFLQALGAPQSNYNADWPRMLMDREPRFYVSVFWGDSDWKYADNYLHISFCQGANGHPSHDYPRSGYMVNRFVDHTLDPHNGNGNITFPSIRLGEIYLDYIEAVLECESNGVSGEGVNHATAMSLWDELRDRSGMPSIIEAYPGASVSQLIELVRKERRVELAFEGHRYYDTRRWMIASSTDSGPMYGMNSMLPSSGTNTPDDFWMRTPFETRIFRNSFYLFPFPQRDIDRNSQLTQNYGW